MIDLDRPPVPERPLPDPSALRYATLIAARQASSARRAPTTRRRTALVGLLVAALLAVVVVGLQRPWQPKVAAPIPPPTATTAPVGPGLPTATRTVDRGPLSATEARSTGITCARSSGRKPAIDQIVYARRLDAGDGTLKAVVLVNAGEHLLCLGGSFSSFGGEGDLGHSVPTPTDRYPAVEADRGGLTWATTKTNGPATQVTENRYFVVAPTVAAVDVVVSVPGQPDRRFRGTPVSGWVAVPVYLAGPVPLHTVDGQSRPNWTVTPHAYTADGTEVALQQLP